MSDGSPSMKAVGGTIAEREEKIFGLWSDVVQAVNRILEAHQSFGFSGIEASLNPKIEDIIHGLGIVDHILNVFLEHDLEHDEKRNALNSKQCVLHIRRLAAALKSGDEEEYQEAIRLLDTQQK